MDRERTTVVRSYAPRVRPLIPPMPYPSVMNFRDLGGLPAEGGGRTRAGLVFRTGALCHATPEDAAALAARFGIHTYVDFRGASEVRRDGEPTHLVAAGVRWHALPVDVREPWFQRLEAPSPRDWSQLYVSILEKHGATVVALLRLIATAPGPVAFGCAAGKDRTGVAAAALLGCLGVSEAEIVRDYARTQGELRAHLHRFVPGADESDPRVAALVRHFFETPPAVMEGFLAEVRRRWGGIRTAVREAGLASRHEALLRERLLESPR